uniref:Reverse transcriptase domain-containing protein n=1 Tax=Caenorhabditis japonica TaxID=281687 RepID=A0A8R1HVJ8_CAEJA
MCWLRCRRQNFRISSGCLFAESFGKVYSTDNGQYTTCDLRTSAHLSEIIFEPYAVELELSKLASKVNTSPDEIPAIFLKKICTSIALPLSIIFNTSMRTGFLPDLWKTAIVKPLFKKGSRSDANNYRPISLTSTICKTMERMIRKEMMKHIYGNKLLSNAQYGFRPHRGTEAQLLHYISCIQSNMEKKKDMSSVYVDFRKAFDTVSLP